MRDIVTQSYYMTDGELHELHKINLEEFGKRFTVTACRNRRAIQITGRYYKVCAAMAELPEKLQDSRFVGHYN